MQRQAFLSSLTNDEAAALLYDWQVWARANQLPPAGDWYVWLILAGRGYGKTRTGAELTCAIAQSMPRCHIALVAETAADARDVMVEGPDSGILAISPPWFYPKYEPSKRRLSWPNGSYANTYSGDEPGQLRGPQHHFAWVDELAKYKYPEETWDNLELGLRLGRQPRVVVTTTPRPIRIIKTLLADPQTHTTSGNTYENIANLAPTFIERVVKKYEGTRLGRQELHAQLLEDTPGALWTRQLIEDTRVTKAPDLDRIVVAIDPSATSGGDEAGIIVAGAVGQGENRHGYILDDRSLQGSPKTWASAAVAAYHTLKADRLVAESNNGGEMISTTIGTIPNAPPVTLIHASRSKHTRAEPIAALYEQGRCHNVGMFAALEDEYCSWVPGEDSPNRLDAAVWALTELMLTGKPAPPRTPPVSQQGY